MELLIIAARKKFRFPSAKGPLTFEQLWDLPLQSKSGASLDSIAQDIDAEVQTAGRTSFVDKGNNPIKTELEQKLAIVVGVIEMKQAENAALADKARRRAELDTLTEALHDKKKAAILNLSEAELEARIKALGA